MPTDIRYSKIQSDMQLEYQSYLGNFLQHSPVVACRGKEGYADLLFGDPHDGALPGIKEALQAQIVESNEVGFRYVHHLPEAQEAATNALCIRTGIDFTPERTFITTGAFAGLICCLKAFCWQGSKVIYLEPPWFYYKAMIKSVGARPHGVELDSHGWTVPYEKLYEAVDYETSAVIINSPHNPTGKTFSEQELAKIANVLQEASRKIGRTIPVISDEAYARIVYEGEHAPSLTRYYKDTVTVYTYGKALLAPSLRLGYLAVTSDFAEFTALKKLFDSIQPTAGWLLPPCFIQRAIPQLENLCVNVDQLKKRRDHLIESLQTGGFNVTPAQGSFYMLIESPIPDDNNYSLILREKNVLVLPGSTMERKGTFRVSLTATDRMIDMAGDVFASSA